MSGNPVCNDIDGSGTPHKLLTLALCRDLVTLDGVPVTEADKAASAAYIQVSTRKSVCVVPLACKCVHGQ